MVLEYFAINVDSIGIINVDGIGILRDKYSQRTPGIFEGGPIPPNCIAPVTIIRDNMLTIIFVITIPGNNYSW
jgi:hypothetical protein